MNTKIQSFIAISDIVSLMNMGSGFISIIMSINHDFYLASIFMIFSLLFDSVDGLIARKTNRNDEFGVAPAIFLYAFSSANANYLEIPTLLVSLFIIICGVLRLTRYNAISDKVKGFIGFPIPGIAIIMATYYLSGLFNIYIALILAIIVSIAMICNKSYEKFDNLYLLILNTLCLLCIVFQIPINIGFVNGAALIVLLTSLTYLFINLIKG
ncbi:CDP-alcohol phosphatidyltransferase family protein [uncultured Methanobrevibacter sp.]|uniref:CDP-alcohol phosphatidyltransferase family protein n=1 Tax=uncultured Methanobrevibacter sp. TaxID=253161 RepID=UPI0025FF9BD1|nr:CDP-alcohol phosphatidyltransferase family protein [uncultured Methanobrevibacter sp.]